MSWIIKGFQGPLQSKFEPGFDAETNSYFYDATFEGDINAIRGLELGLQQSGFTYHISNEGAVFTLVVRVATEEPIDRYEIFTEGQEKSIWEFPDCTLASRNYDAGLAEGDPTWRSLGEDAVRTRSAFGSVNGTIENLVVKALRDGVTGWQVDFVALRRTRRIRREFAFAAGQFNLDIGLLIYTNSQLAVPNDVAFKLPTASHPVSTEYQWGWRRRSQRVELVGQWFEQTIELLFAPWSLLFYDPATSNLDW